MSCACVCKGAVRRKCQRDVLAVLLLLQLGLQARATCASGLDIKTKQKTLEKTVVAVQFSACLQRTHRLFAEFVAC
jgi:hypothetical protein